jgi:hypothetical protein
MLNGDIAGLAVFQDPYAFIGIKKINNVNYIIMVNNGKIIDSAEVGISTIYLRAQAKYGTSSASFAYSLDNQSFTKFGNDLAMRFNLSVFTGNKFCLFNYATISTGGYVDFDWFRISFSALTDISPAEGLLNDHVPKSIYLGQNYPNPFNPSTKIRFTIPRNPPSSPPEKSSGQALYRRGETGGVVVSLRVYDILGREVATLVNEEKPAGDYEVEFQPRIDDKQMASSVYFYSLKAGDFYKTMKMILIR